MKRFIMMMGLPGSGKSTAAKKLVKDGGALISSDALRIEHYINKGIQEYNRSAIFAKVLENVEQEIKIGTDIIVIDALNLTSRRRINFLREVDRWCKKYSVCYQKEIHIVATPLDTCMERVEQRQGTGAVNEMTSDIVVALVSQFEIPYKEEGWDNIRFNWDSNFFEEVDLDRLQKDMDFNQMNKYHNETVLKHSKTVQEILWLEKFPHPECGLLHDIGKIYTQEEYFNEALGKIQKRYYNHENYSAFFVATNPMLLVDASVEEFLEILFVINYHMLPMQWTEKNMAKQIDRYGQEKVDLLLRFNKADKYRKEE